MENFSAILQKSGLFEGIEERDILPLLKCLNASEREYVKDETVFYEGERASKVGILLSGSVIVARHGYDGNRSVISSVGEGGLIGEAFACSDKRYSMSVEASASSRILFLDVNRIVTPCCNACGFHSKIIFNLLRIVANKNIELSRRMDVTSKKTTREKLLYYLSTEAQIRGSKMFTLPYDRQALADYLDVDRSGLSSEIGKLKKEGVIDCSKSCFKLLK